MACTERLPGLPRRAGERLAEAEVQRIANESECDAGWGWACGQAGWAHYQGEGARVGGDAKAPIREPDPAEPVAAVLVASYAPTVRTAEGATFRPTNAQLSAGIRYLLDLPA